MDIVQKAKERHAQLKAQIEAVEALRPEFERLGAFLRQAEEIERQEWPALSVANFPNAKPELLTPDSPQIAENIAPMRSPAFGLGGELTGEMAARVLETFGPRLHVSEILKHLQAQGWKGSGNERRNYKNVYQNLSSKPKRFRSIGKATFELVRKEPKREQGR